MAGYSKTPLAKKLGIKQGFKIVLVNAPEYYWNLFDELPNDIEQLDPDEQVQADFIHFFTKSADELRNTLPGLKKLLVKNGMLWISWPKKASKVATDVSDMVVRNVGLDTGLVDVKVCAVDEIWSGLKFMYRVADR